MANNYSQFTMSPDSLYLSEMHQAYLDMTGAGLEKESDGRFYVYWETCLDEDIEDDQIEDALLEGDINPEQADFLRKNGFMDMMRHILHYNTKVTHLEIQGAWTCSKMRPGEFGGGIYVISRTEHLWLGTGSAGYNSETGKIEVNYTVHPFEPAPAE